MVKIVSVGRRSLAERAGVLRGDMLVSINGNAIRDVLDYRFYLAESSVRLCVLRDGREVCFDIEKDEYDDIGLTFETPLMDKKHTCKNGCIFCFIDQNPEGMRKPIYFKDDDSRLSFIHGNYVTLTNMTRDDVERIVKMRMSPINISVHTTNPDLRVLMMKNKHAGEVLSYLDDFKSAGLTMAGQIVLCRGINDGEELLRTMRDLSRYLPELSSVSVVPAGLTAHRGGLYPLSQYTPEEAGEVIDAVVGFGDTLLKQYGTRVFFPADELYLKAKRELPPEEFYEGYPQIENGVGMLRSFIEEFSLAESDVSDMRRLLKRRRNISVATGEASYGMISSLCDRVMQICPNMKIKVYKIVNNFFGHSITVSGLLTGKDILEQLKGEALGQELLIPENALRRDDDDFLCGMTRKELSRALSVRVTPVPSDGYELLRRLLRA
ncbi:MAG: DUF512 domain-containing protein [Clostridia bacterium]|nr:DUF512 domain-containing protein [Clostridia bacterium]